VDAEVATWAAQQQQARRAVHEGAKELRMGEAEMKQLEARACARVLGGVEPCAAAKAVLEEMRRANQRQAASRAVANALLRRPPVVQQLRSALEACVFAVVTQGDEADAAALATLKRCDGLAGEVRKLLAPKLAAVGVEASEAEQRRLEEQAVAAVMGEDSVKVQDAVDECVERHAEGQRSITDQSVWDTDGNTSRQRAGPEAHDPIKPDASGEGGTRPPVEATGRRQADASQLQAAGVDAFLAKMGTTLKQVESATTLDWSSQRIDDADCDVISYLIASGAMASLQELWLNSNQICDAGVKSLAESCAGGAMARLEILDLSRNQIGDAGLEALAKACAGGAMTNLTNLRLSRNQIGDAGLASLAGACANGALAKLETLSLNRNQIGDAGV